MTEIDTIARMQVESGTRRERGPYVLTYSGVHFHPFDPRSSEVRVEDIAHGLAYSARYNGAGKQFYSTAEHSVLLAQWLLPRHGERAALYGLLHDAPEPLSGFGDVLRPVKDRAPIIKETETRIWGAVAAAFGLAPLIPVEVHEADARIIADEMAQNMTELDPGYTAPLGVRLEFWSPAVAEVHFLDCFRKLVRGERLAA